MINGLPNNARWHKTWSTHYPMLILAMLKTKKPIIEIGAGPMSTMLFHWMAFLNHTVAYSYENDLEYYDVIKTFASHTHKIRFVKEWADVPTDGDWGVAFIDNHPSETRGKQAIRFKDNTDFVIIHDAEKPGVHNLFESYKHFKYKYVWTDSKPWTAILSNRFDVADMFGRPEENKIKQYLDKNFEGQKMPIEIPDVDRESLAEMFGVLGLNRGVEIGTNEAEFAKILGEKNRKIELYCVDPQQPYLEFESAERQSHYDNLFEKCKKVLATYNAKLIRKTSMEAVNDFDDNSIDFVYIDGNHDYKHVMEDITEWAKKVRPGGIVAGHDYLSLVKTKYPLEVKEALHDYIKQNNIETWFVLGRKEKNTGEKRDKCRSWFFIKQ